MVDRKQFETKVSRWQSSNWYHALSLIERVPAWWQPEYKMVEQPAAREKAEKRLQAWKQRKPFDQGTFFADRLAASSLTEDAFLALLAEPVANLHARTAPTPAWLQTLEETFTRSDSDKPVLQQAAERIQPAGGSLAACLPALLPLINYGIDQVQTRLQELTQQYTDLPFDPQTVLQPLCELLPKQLLFKGDKTFVLEMHVARIQKRLSGETPEERFASFARYLSEPENISVLLEEYPVLARQFVITVEQWATFACEVLTHLCQDWHALHAFFTPHHQPGPLTGLQEVGDMHNRGRSTLLLTFASGFRLLYKPKPMAVDVHFQELLAWLNEQGANPEFRLLKVLDRGDYGWSEFIQATSCDHPDEVARFYERQGAYLALLYALNATDFHGENVIASGEHPFLVDLEALFHPQISGHDSLEATAITARTLENSVLRVGLLPLRIWSSEESDGVDLTGLGWQEGQLTPQAVPHWVDTGTDQMHIARRHLAMPGKQNRPKLNGQDVQVLDYKDQISSGFTHMYQILCRVRNTLLEEQLPAFAQDKIRLLVRPTQTYATLLAESFHPDLLRDALERDRLFDLLWLEVEHRPYLAQVIGAEQQDLLNGDIPLFTTTVGSSTIFSADHQPLELQFMQTGLESVRQRVAQLSERDLAKQRWIIEAALSSVAMGPDRGGDYPLFQAIPSPVPPSVSKKQLLSAATAIGNRLVELASYDGREACWLGLTMINDRVWSLMPTECDLYNGTSGIALFLAYLGHVTGEASFTRMARGALTTVQAQLAHLKKQSQSVGIGVFEGLGSAIYLLMHLAILWDEPALLHEAEALTELLPPLIAQDTRLDVMGGTAGCLLNLISLYSIRPTRRIQEIARQCGERLLATAKVMAEGIAWQTVKGQEPLGGFSHGTSGIALSLFKLGGITREERFDHLARAALVYDRSLFIPGKQNWRDLRLLPASPASARQELIVGEQDKTMVAWCHGAPGIALGRLGMLDYIDDMVIREEIEIALRTTLSTGLAQNHSLCHGALGNLDVVLLAAQRLNSAMYREQLDRAIAAVITQGETWGWLTGVPDGVETPGLMLGLAGIGYELLRLAEPAQVPSVLLIEPPYLA